MVFLQVSTSCFQVILEQLHKTGAPSDSPPTPSSAKEEMLVSKVAWKSEEGGPRSPKNCLVIPGTPEDGEWIFASEKNMAMLGGYRSVLLKMYTHEI